MGRRSLQKIDPALDLSQWLIPEDQLPHPFDVDALFGHTAPLEIEVGTGKGLFVAQLTSVKPDHVVLGIELARRYARFTAARLAELNRRNGKVIHGDGVRIFQQWLPDACAQAVHVYFPDPWWKKRHHKRRIMTAPFVGNVQRVLTPDGVLHFWTDVQAYFDATLALIADMDVFCTPVFPTPQPAEHDLDYRTHFERRTRLHDQPVYRAEFHRSR